MLSIPRGLNLFLQLFVLDLFVSNVLVFYNDICFENLANVNYFYKVIENNFFVYFYRLISYFVNYLVFCFDNCGN